MEVYASKQPEGPFKQSNTGEEIVISLVEPVRKTSRNTTFDN